MDNDDELVKKAIDLVRQYERTSASFLQRKLGIGYPRAAMLLDQLESLGIVGPDEGSTKERTVLKDDLKGARCLVCKMGILRSGKTLFGEIDETFLKCTYCHLEYHRQSGRYILKGILSGYTTWKYFEGQQLSLEELRRILQGGSSDAQIAAQEKQLKIERLQEERRRIKEEEPKRLELQRQEELKKQRQTPQWYLAKAKSIIGMPEHETHTYMAFSVTSPEQTREHLTQVGQMKEDLQLLRQEIIQQAKDLGTGERHSYMLVVEDIDSFLLKLDQLKLQIEKARTPVAHKEGSLRLEDLLVELNSLVGLESVKSEVTGLINFLKVQKLRESKGLPTAPMSLHHVFYGNPGTGKTTVARLLSQIFKSLNLLSIGHLVETDRAGLVAGYVGQTALKVNEVVNKALGGILFIDEAYSLAGQGNDFGQEAIETLLKQMEDHRDDLVVIVAGYTDRMNEFLSSNPGLRSRFNRYLRFDDYTPLQLVTIFELFCEKAGYHLSPTAREKLQLVFSAAYDKRDKAFGNGRFARNLFERTISNQANRVVALPNANPQTFSAIDVADIPERVIDDLT